MPNEIVFNEICMVVLLPHKNQIVNNYLNQ